MLQTYPRALDLRPLIAKKSLLFFGPRATGKSTLIRSQLNERCFVIDLLKSRYYADLLADPAGLENLIEAQTRADIVVIDEVQRIPALLNEVHRLIEEKGIRFLLTGSSARKLRREGANMLAGRAWKAELFGLTWTEIPDFKLDFALRYGTLPAVWQSESPENDLDAYVTTYLKEEIEIESRLRNLPAFARFLKVSALSDGKLINFSQIASDSAIPETTVKSYFQILQDTLLGFSLEPFTATRKRKAIGTAKFYLFDNGVKHTILGTEQLDRNSDLYGSAFESFLGNELRAYLSYRRIKKDLLFWRSKSQFEVDFVVGEQLAIEVKATSRVTEKHLRGLTALAEEEIFENFYLVSQDPVARTANIGSGKKALLLPWGEFLARLWADKLLPARKKS
ncbi:ATP-binding protein [Bdellovibrionota bacterium FG-1]